MLAIQFVKKSMYTRPWIPKLIVLLGEHHISFRNMYLYGIYISCYWYKTLETTKSELNTFCTFVQNLMEKYPWISNFIFFKIFFFFSHEPYQNSPYFLLNSNISLFPKHNYHWLLIYFFRNYNLLLIQVANNSSNN